MTMTNGGENSSYDLALTTHDCQLGLIYTHNNNTTWYNTFTGVAGGQITSGIPFGTSVTATCSVPLGLLAHEPNGWVGDGNFQMKLVNKLSSIPRGTMAWVHFEGTWTRPVNFSLTTGSIIYTGRLNNTGGCPTKPCLWVDYKSHVNYTLQTLSWIVTKNVLDQTMFVGAGGGPVGEYWDTQYGYSLGFVPSGNYKVFLFVTTSDMVAISTTTELDITVP